MHMGMSYSDIRKLPLSYRRWFVERLIKYFKDKNKKNNNSSADINQKTVEEKAVEFKKIEKLFKKFS
jgi:hypothetical protein